MRGGAKKASKHVVESLESRVLFTSAAFDPTYGVGGFAMPSFRFENIPASTPVGVVDNKSLIIDDQGRLLIGKLRLNPDSSVDRTFNNQAPLLFSAGARQADGRILMAGQSTRPDFPSNSQILVRLLPDGSLDPTFNGDGIVEFPDSNASITAIAVGPSQEIYVGNSSGQIQRLNSDGSRDLTYGIANRQSLQTIGLLRALPDGKLLAFGEGSIFNLRRLNPDGSPDFTFGSFGTAFAPPTAFLSSAGSDGALAIDAQGRILVSASRYDPVTGASVFIVRFSPDGVYDPTFGINGRSQAIPGSGDGRLNALRVLPDGKILVAGDVPSPSSPDQQPDGIIVRLLSDGTLDPAFRHGGADKIDISGWDNLFALDITPDDHIVAIGGRSPDGRDGLEIVKLDLTGKLDSGFADGGKAVVPRFFDPVILDAKPAPGGKTYLALDESDLGGNVASRHFPLTRLNADGTVDTTFGRFGRPDAIPGVSPPYAQVKSLTVQPDGKPVVLVGKLNGPTEALIRFTLDGAPDPTFGTNGVISSSTLDVGVFVTPYTGGLLVGAGNGIARLNNNGSLNTSFGSNGIAKVPDWISQWVVQPSGKIVVSTYTGGFAHKPSSVVRLTTSGQLDPTFATGGKFTSNGPSPFYLLLQSGRLLLHSGRTIYGLTVDGQPDSTFGQGGKLVLNDERALPLILPDDRIVVHSDDDLSILSANGLTRRTARIEKAALPVTPQYPDVFYAGSGRLGVILSRSNTISKYTPEFPSTLSVRRVGTLAVEGDSAAASNAQFVVTREGDVSAALDVPIIVSGTATPSADYTAFPDHVTIPAGSTTVTIPVVALADGPIEPTEFVTITLGSVNGYVHDPDAKSATASIVGKDEIDQFAGGDIPVDLTIGRTATVEQLTLSSPQDSDTFDVFLPSPGTLHVFVENDTSVAHALANLVGGTTGGGLSSARQLVPSGSEYLYNATSGGTARISVRTAWSARANLGVPGYLVRFEFVPGIQIGSVTKFSNNSAYDNHTPGPSDADFTALANFGSSAGINGVWTEGAASDYQPTPDDFEYLMDQGGTLLGWQRAPDPVSVTKTRVTLPDGQLRDRLTFIWPDGAIKNRTLSIRVRTAVPGNAVSGTPNTLFTANLVGDTSDSSQTRAVTATDLVSVRNAIGSPEFLNTLDINRDGRVNAADLVLVRNNLGHALSKAALPQGIGKQFLVAPPLARWRPEGRGSGLADLADAGFAPVRRRD